MAHLRKIAATALVMGMTTGAGLAQTDAIPAEFPPSSYTGNQYVDSKGCAFIRAGIGGAVNWVPRLTRSREQMCNFQPTFPNDGAPTADESNVAAAPVIEITPEVAAEPAAPAVATAPAPTAAAPKPAAPARATRTRRAAPAAPAAVVSPRIVAPAPAAPKPTVTMAQVCAGRYGPQPGYISARTGQPVDCGPAPRKAKAARTTARVAAVAAPQRLSMDEICERAASGTTFQRPDGTPVKCTRTYGVPASNPTHPTGPARVPQGYEKVWTDGRINPQRGKAASRRVPTRSAPASLGHAYVQVGTFGVPANADRMIKRLAAMGYPVATERVGPLRAVAAGPFKTKTELHAALQAVRALGFEDAFTRN